MDGAEGLGCGAAREQISACHDGECAPTRELQLHLASCGACQEFAAACGDLSRGFAASRAATAPAGLEERLLARTRRPGLRIVRLQIGAASIGRLAAALIGLAAVGALAVSVERAAGGGSSSRTNVAHVPGPASEAPASLVSWLEPLRGRALHPDDAALARWSTAAAAVGRGPAALKEVGR